jgi:hypothetical protein
MGSILLSSPVLLTDIMLPRPDSDTDLLMRTPPSNSPPSSSDERSLPGSPNVTSRTQLSDLGAGVFTQVNDYLEGGGDQRGKKQREEREQKMAAEAEFEKLVHKDWKEGRDPPPAKMPLPKNCLASL